MRRYWMATRHPWACLVFVLPLLALYEVGLHLLGNTPPEHLRNGADVWLRLALGELGAPMLYGAPLFLVAILLGWACLYRGARPPDYFSAWLGMLLESVVFAGALYGLCRGLWPLLHAIPMMSVSASAASPTEPAIIHLVRYLGAGIYEETLFRLLLFSGLIAIFNWGDFPRYGGLAIAALASSVVFAAAHNLGPNGEAFHPYIFVFRSMAGLFFAWLFCTRGFGITVGAHSGYDVLVGVLMQA